MQLPHCWVHIKTHINSKHTEIKVWCDHTRQWNGKTHSSKNQLLSPSQMHPFTEYLQRDAEESHVHHWKSSDQNTYFPAYTFSLIYQNSISPNQKDEKCIRHSIKNARFCQKPRPVLVCPYQALQTRLIYNTLYLRHDAPLKLPKCRMSSQCTPSVPSNAWCSPNQFNSGIVHMPSSRDAFDVQDSLTRT